MMHVTGAFLIDKLPHEDEASEKNFEALTDRGQHTLRLFFTIAQYLLSTQGTLGPTITFFLNGDVQPISQLANVDGLKTPEYMAKLKPMVDALQPTAYIVVAEAWTKQFTTYEEAAAYSAAGQRPSTDPTHKEALVLYLEAGGPDAYECAVLKAELHGEEGDEHRELGKCSVTSTNHTKKAQFSAEFSGLLTGHYHTGSLH